MTTSIQMTDGINVNIHPHAKKRKKDTSNYDIYLLFTISEHGISQFTPEMSTGISVPLKEWGSKEMKGRGERAGLINAKLNQLLQRAQLGFENFRSSNVNTCTQVRDEIRTTIKTKVTGKAPRGMKTELTSSLRSRTVDAVLEHLFTSKKQAPERQRIYKHAIGILHRYFQETKKATPLITNISEDDLTSFQVWFRENYRCTHGKRKGQPPAQDSTTTWFTMIAAVFKHAERRMKILPRSPLPENFQGSFADIEKPVLTESERMALLNLDDNTLTHSEAVAKYCLCVQMLTGMGYGDLKSLTLEHMKFHRDSKRWHLQKQRNKNGTTFNVPLTTRAKQCFDRLRELAAGTDTLFKLPTIDFMNRSYQKLTRKAGVKTHTTTYTLRHAFSVDYMDNDGTLEDLGKMIGNAIRNTKRYGRISTKRLAAKAAVLESKSKMHQ